MIRKIGIFLAAIAIGELLYTSCKKKEDVPQTNIPPVDSPIKTDPYALPGRYNDTIKGTWTFDHSLYRTTPIFDTTYYYADTSIRIMALTDSTILFGFDTLTYTGTGKGVGPGGYVDTSSIVQWQKATNRPWGTIYANLRLYRKSDTLTYEVYTPTISPGASYYEWYATRVTH